MACDLHWDTTVLACHFDGADNGTTFTDEKGNTVTANGNTVTKTATKKFGTASAYFDGTGDYLSISGTSSLQLGTADFTIEFWCNLTSVSDWGRVLSTGSYLDSGNVNISKEETTNKLYFQISDTTTRPHITSDSSIIDSQWHHCVFQRNSNTLEMFIDGVKQSLTASDSPHNLTSSSLKVGIGFSEDGSSSAANMNGYIDDLRITKGVARYTANFTPPIAAFITNQCTISGTVEDETATLTDRLVRAYRRDTGALVGQAISSATTGVYSIPVTHDGECTVTCLDSNSNPPSGGAENALIFDRVLPV